MKIQLQLKHYLSAAPGFEVSSCAGGSLQNTTRMLAKHHGQAGVYTTTLLMYT